MTQVITKNSSVDRQSTDRADVLVITSELPWPLNTGGHIRTYHLMRALARQFNVRLVTAMESDDQQGLQELSNAGVNVHPAPVGARRRFDEVRRIASSALRREPYVMFNRHNRPPFADAVREQLRVQRPDVVYLDHLDPYSFRGLFPDGVPVVADLHNVYSKLAARVADEKSWPASAYLHREARLIARMEKAVARDASVVMAVSAQEQREFQELGSRNAHLVPNGVDCSLYKDFPTGRSNERPVFLYLGALSWQPNAAAAEFLARDVMPNVLKHAPDAVLQIVGRNPGPEVETLTQLPGVELHANVPDVGVYLKQASLLAVPLDSGGGTRLKILEAFAAGLPVVSTAIGCEGIDCINGQHLWVAERPEFGEAMLEAVSAPELATTYATNARQLAKEIYDWPVIGKAACDAVATCLD